MNSPPPDLHRCRYRSPEGAQCPYRSKTKICVGHQDAKSEDEFKTFAKWLLDRGDGNWVGFVVPPLTLTGFEVSTDIDLSYATLSSASLHNCSFEKLTLRHARCNGPLACTRVTFRGCLDLRNSRFEDQCSLDLYTRGGLSGEQASFAAALELRGELMGEVRFSRANFADAVSFQGGHTVFMTVGSDAPSPPSQRMPLFMSETYLDEVDFRRPDRIRFIGVDLRKVLFGSTNILGARFQDVQWFQDTLGRRGIYDEVFANASDSDYRARALPALEAQYRGIRMALEQNKDYDTAADFYVGEMEAKRRRKTTRLQRHLLSIEAIYQFASRYGTSAARAGVVLAGIIIVHATISWAFSCSVAWPVVVCGSCLDDGLLYSARTLLPFRGAYVYAHGFRGALDVLFQAANTIQITLLVLAMRSRIKRH